MYVIQLLCQKLQSQHMQDTYIRVWQNIGVNSFIFVFFQTSRNKEQTFESSYNTHCPLQSFHHHGNSEPVVHHSPLYFCNNPINSLVTSPD